MIYEDGDVIVVNKPNLVGAARLQPALHVGIAGIPGQNGPVGHRLPALWGWWSTPPQDTLMAL